MDMKRLVFNTFYEAYMALMEEKEQPTKVLIHGIEYTIIVYGNGTYDIIK